MAQNDSLRELHSFDQVLPHDETGCWPADLRPTERASRETASRLRAVTAAHCLTARQGRILFLVVSGLSNKEIAARLRCSEVTVETQMTTLLRRTRSSSRAVLVARFWLEHDV